MSTRRLTQAEHDWRQSLRTYQLELKETNRTFTGDINETNRALLNQLFVVAGGYITLCTALLITKEIAHTLTLSKHARYIVVIVILLSLASVFCGIWQLSVDSRFLRMRKRSNAGLIKRISQEPVISPHELDTLIALQDKEFQDGKSSDWWLWSQFGCLALGGVGIFLLVIYLLFIAKINF